MVSTCLPITAIVNEAYTRGLEVFRGELFVEHLAGLGQELLGFGMGWIAKSLVQHIYSEYVFHSV